MTVTCFFRSAGWLRIVLFLYAVAVPFSNSAAEIVKVLLILTAAVLYCTDDQKFHFSHAGLFFLLMSGWVLFSALVSFSSSVLHRLPHIFSQLLLLPAGFLVFRFTGRRLFFRMMLAAAGAAALAGIFYFLLLNNSAARAAGFLGHPNHFAQMLSSLVFCMPAVLSDSDRKWRLVALCSGLLIAVALVATGTRAAWLGAAAGGFVVLFFYFSIRRILYFSAIFVLLLAVISGVLFPGRISQAVNPGSRDWRLRAVIYRCAWKAASDRPFTGCGPGRFAEIYRKRYLEADSGFARMDRAGKSDLKTHFHAHNNFLHLAAVSGFPALLFLLLFLFFTARDVYRAGRRNRAAVFFILPPAVLFVQGVFDFTLFGAVSGNILWFFLGGFYSCTIFPDEDAVS